MERHFARENTQMINSTWNNVQHHDTLGKWKLKQQWNSTMHLSEWLKLKK